VFRREGFPLKACLPNIALVLVRLLLLAPGIMGQTGTDTGLLPPGFQLRIDANPKSATVGDPIQIDLDITVPSGFQVNLPTLGKEIGDFSILEFYPGPNIPVSATPHNSARPTPTQPGLIHHHVRIIAAAYKTGIVSFPQVQLQLRTTEGKQIPVSSPPVKIEIQSVLAGKNRDLKDLKKQAEIPEPVRWVRWHTGLLALIVLCIFAWFLWKRRKRTSDAPATPPQDLLQLAESDLRALLARGFPESGRVKEFYILLSEIVKRILEAGYGINTAERTTSEIIDTLHRTSKSNLENVERIESFLLRCDMVKFAKYIPAKSEHESTAAVALWILENSRQSSVVSKKDPLTTND
jgi:hypothetical protein